ncbi:MAG: fasciclin domain-containing protein [Bacteroidales bacterium]
MFYRCLRYYILIIITIAGIVSHGCRDNWDQDKYQPPEWQKGKIFTQIQEEDDLETFALLLRITGYDTILNTSGSYTVFAPTDEAFNSFFQEYPEYQFVTDSAKSSRKLTSLVEFQIIFNAWSQEQFQSLDIDGWIDPKDAFSEPKAFKRKTLYRETNKKYPTVQKGDYDQIVDSLETKNRKIAYTNSNKYSPIFFDDFFNVYNLAFEDYEFYFNRIFKSGKLYFAGAEFYERIPAENGFIYKTDEVVLPLPNGEEILEREYNSYNYHAFLDLIHQFSKFNINLEATYEQPGADLGLEVDTLFNLSYPDLLFNIQNELTGNTNDQKQTIREHYGLLAPTDAAIEAFMNENLSTWGNLNNIPVIVKKVIINSHMTKAPVYPSDIAKGFINGEGDRVFLNESEIIQTTFGSNCSFIGLNRAIVPRVITSICRPVYLTRDYQIMMYALDATKVLEAAKKPNATFSFYLPSDLGIGLGGDSSLSVVITDPELNRYHFEAYQKGANSFVNVPITELRKKILNQIGISIPRGYANKEFIKNLGGNYIIVDHNDGTVRGTAPTTFGFNGDSVVHLKPEKYSGYTDNGEVFDVDTWFSFSKASYYGIFISEYPYFLDLLEKAGLFNPSFFTFPFLIPGEPYTIFIPSQQALEEYRADTLSKEELNQFLRYHFVKGELIFTDGNQPGGNYPTTRVDESSTTTQSKQSTLHILTKPDMIELLDKENSVYLTIPEEDGKTNRTVVFETVNNSTSEWDFITTAVIHQIDKVLNKDSLQAR